VRKYHPPPQRTTNLELERTRAACLLYIGGLKALQTASVVASLPLLVVYAMLYAAIIKTLKQWQATETQSATV